MSKKKTGSWYAEIFRKVHWDFDIPGYILNVGERFSSGKFIEELKKGKVQAVQFYAKGADGRSFYDTKVGIKHPHLKRDLLGEISDSLKIKKFSKKKRREGNDQQNQRANT